MTSRSASINEIYLRNYSVKRSLGGATIDETWIGVIVAHVMSLPPTEPCDTANAIAGLALCKAIIWC